MIKSITMGLRRPGLKRAGLGDMVERAAHPLAVALKLPCLDEKQQLRPESPCGRRRAKLNDLGKKIGIGI
jgi:hypothetical protein